MRLPLRRKRGIMYFIFFLFLVEGVWFGDVRAGTCERGRESGVADRNEHAKIIKSEQVQFGARVLFQLALYQKLSNVC